VIPPVRLEIEWNRLLGDMSDVSFLALPARETKELDACVVVVVPKSSTTSGRACLVGVVDFGFNLGETPTTLYRTRPRLH
jgi:hypothetical protein